MNTANQLTKFSYTMVSCTMALTLLSCASVNKLEYKKSELSELERKQQDKSSIVKGTNLDKPTVNSDVEYLAPLKSENYISPQQQLKQQQYQFNQSSPVKLAVENMPLRDFIYYVFGDLLAVNYVLDEAAINTELSVSIKIEQEIDATELFEVAADLLKEKGLSIQLKQKVFYVFSASNKEDTRDIQLGLGNKPADVPLGSEQVLQLVPLKYTSFPRIQRVMYNLVQAEVYAESDYAGLSIKGKRSEVVRALNLIQLLDQPSAKSQYIGIYPLVFLMPNDFISNITSLLQEDGFDIQNGIKFTPIEHLNSVIIHASEQHILDRVDMWKSHIDKASETSDKQYFLFYPKRANAETLGESLNNILGLQSGRTASRPTTSAANTRSPNSSSNSSSSTARGSSSSLFDGIAIDKHRNALVFYMEPKEYQAIYPLLTQLDVLPKQVIVDATIMEVTLTDRLNYGVEWFIKNNIDSFGTQDGLGDLGGGFTFTLDKPGLDVVLSALATTNQVNIVSNPKLMVTNGETAVLSVGTEIPVISSSVSDATQGNGQVLQTVQYRSTGVNLSVTPTVNAQNYVELEIDQKLSEAGANELSGVDSPILLNREVQTKVLIETGQTLVLAGLISENVSNRDTKVPLLGDIPIIGEAFKNNVDRKTKTELLLLITPRVVNNSDDLSIIKRAVGSKFNQIDLGQDF